MKGHTQTQHRVSESTHGALTRTFAGEIREERVAWRVDSLRLLMPTNFSKVWTTRAVLFWSSSFDTKPICTCFVCVCVCVCVWCVGEKESERESERECQRESERQRGRERERGRRVCACVYGRERAREREGERGRERDRQRKRETQVDETKTERFLSRKHTSRLISAEPCF